MLNQVVLIGRLTADPELKHTAGNGTPVINITLAVNRAFASKEGEKEADFIAVTVWGKQAENCATYIGKGSLVAVTGRLQIDNYEDSEGNKRKAAKVIAQNVRFLDRRQNGDDEDRPF